MGKEIDIAGRRIGLGQPVYIVAELSANHGKSFDKAAQIIRQAQAAGADAVKLQTYTADTLTMPSEKAHFRISERGLWAGRTLYDLYREAFTPWDWQSKLKRVANDLGLALFSTPFDPSSVDFLESIDVPAYKIASFELVDLPLIKRVAATGKPMIMATGMATLSEIEDAVLAATVAGATQIALLKCTSAYPAPPEEMHLKTISHLAATFNVPAGLSDHTLGIAVPVAAVAVGAVIVEKHLTLSRADGGPDSAFSLEPAEFKAMAEAIRTTEKALGEINYGPSQHEVENRGFRRSLFVTENVLAGSELTKENVRSIRPATGLAPKYFDRILGRRFVRNVEGGTPLSWDDLFQ